MSFVVTRGWLKANATKACGWTRLQLAVLNVSWPPHGGWMNRVVGKSISLEQKAEFERLGEQHRARLADDLPAVRAEIAKSADGPAPTTEQAVLAVARALDESRRAGKPLAGDPLSGKAFNYMNLCDQARGRLGMDASAQAKQIVKAVTAALMRRRKPRNHTGKVQMLREFLGYEPATKRGFITTVRAPRERSQRSPKRARGGYWGNEFFDSREWQELRYRVLKHYGRKCMACGATRGEMHVDHIKPRSKYPELALEFSNMQVLCRDCNKGKGAWDETDWRTPEQRDVFFVELKDPNRTGAKLN